MPGRCSPWPFLIAVAIVLPLAGCGGDGDEVSDQEIVDAIGMQGRESLIEGQEISGYESPSDGTCTIGGVLNSPEEVEEAQADPASSELMVSSDESVGVTDGPPDFFEECRRQVQEGLDSLAGG